MSLRPGTRLGLYEIESLLTDGKYLYFHRPSLRSLRLPAFSRALEPHLFRKLTQGSPPLASHALCGAIEELQETRTVRQHEGLHILVFGEVHQGGAGLAVSRDHDRSRLCFLHEFTELVLDFINGCYLHSSNSSPSTNSLSPSLTPMTVKMISSDGAIPKKKLKI